MELFKIWATMIAPSLATVLITLTYMPQIIKTYKTKSVKDLSVAFWVLLLGFLVCMVSNATYLFITAPNGLGYLLTEIVNFTLAAVVFGQIVYYTKKNKSGKEKKGPHGESHSFKIIDMGTNDLTKSDSIIKKVVKSPEDK